MQGGGVTVRHHWLWLSTSLGAALAFWLIHARAWWRIDAASEGHSIKKMDSAALFGYAQDRLMQVLRMTGACLGLSFPQNCHGLGQGVCIQLGRLGRKHKHTLLREAPAAMRLQHAKKYSPLLGEGSKNVY